jgi:hypothetical protein
MGPRICGGRRAVAVHTAPRVRPQDSRAEPQDPDDEQQGEHAPADPTPRSRHPSQPRVPRPLTGIEIDLSESAQLYPTRHGS